MSTIRLVGAASALVAAALIGGTLITSVAAAPTASSVAASVPRPAEPSPGTSGDPAAREPGAYCTAFRVAFARNLGKSEAEVVAAAKAAIGTAIDQAVADGSMTKAAADRIKSRVAASGADGCGLLAGRGGKVQAAVLGVAKDGLGAAADALGMALPDLRAALRSGQTLQEVAASKGVAYAAVSAAVTTSVKSDLDAAVAAGTITQARADRILARLDRRLADGWRRRAN